MLWSKEKKKIIVMDTTIQTAKKIYLKTCHLFTYVTAYNYWPDKGVN